MREARSESDWRRHREMREELRAICLEAVSACDDLPALVKEHREAVGAVEITTFDQSYIEFLDTQIALEPRGREWANRLKLRKSNLLNYVGRELASCRLKWGTFHYWFRIDPISGTVVHWEDYNENK